MRHRFLPPLGPALMLAALLLPGCIGLRTYGEDRVRDLSDVIDVRYGTGFGLGASVQLGPAFSTGLGCSPEWYTREWFGRKSVEVDDGLFAGGLLVSYDGDYVRRRGESAWVRRGDSTTGSFSVLIFTINTGRGGPFAGDAAWFEEPAGSPPLFTAMRMGGTVYLPGVNGGLYWNIGETLDFFCGLVTYDPMHDDGYPKFFTPGAPAPVLAPASIPDSASLSDSAPPSSP